MRLQTIKINDHGDRQFIGLTGIDDPRTLTIVIGYNEALAIDRFVKETRPPRPLTHELISNLVQASGCKVERVDITELRNGTFYAMIRLEQPDGNIIEVDAPTQGGRIEDVGHPGVVVASADIVAADAYATRFFDLKPEEIGHIRRAAERGLGVMDLDKVKIREEGV